MSLETILSYVPSIAPFIQNERITDNAINPNGSVCIQEDGQRRQVEAEISQPNLKHAAKRIAKEVGETLSEANPILDAPTGWFTGVDQASASGGEYLAGH